MAGAFADEPLGLPHLLHVSTVPLSVSLSTERTSASEVAVTVCRPVTRIVGSKFHATSWHVLIIRRRRRTLLVADRLIFRIRQLDADLMDALLRKPGKPPGLKQEGPPHAARNLAL